MSVTLQAVVACDHKGCNEVNIDGGDREEAFKRLRARGWRCDRLRQYCPLHAVRPPKLSEPAERLIEELRGHPCGDAVKLKARGLQIAEPLVQLGILERCGPMHFRLRVRDDASKPALVKTSTGYVDVAELLHQRRR